MAKNEAKIKFTAETGEFNKSIQDANREMSELRAELKLNETQMKSTGATVEALEEQHSILEKQLKASESKTEALNEKFKKAVEIFGENSAEASKLRVQLLNAETAEEKVRQAVAKCVDELENLDDSLEQVDESTEKATEGFTVMKGAMADLVADGIEKVVSGFGEIASSAFTMANDIDKATNTFVAQTGESTENAELFEDAMVNIYNGNYGESFEDIADAMASVKTSMGDIDPGHLQNLTQQGLILRDTFDMDVNESIRAVNSMMDQFGITADEAYSLIAQGAQNGLNQNGDLLDVVNEYAVQFKNAGYSAEDMFNMLANGVDAGTWSVDKLGDAVKEMNIRLSDGTADEALMQLGLGFEYAAVDAEALHKAELKVSDAKLKLTSAQEKATEALWKHGQSSVEYQKAVNDVAKAEVALTEAQEAYNKEASATEYNLDAIKEKLAAGGKTGQEAMNQIMTALMGVEDEQERYLLGQSIMGTMWEDLGEEAVSALMNTRGEISTTKDALTEIDAIKYNDLGSALEGIKRNLETSVAQPIQENVMPAVNEFIEDVDWQGAGNTIGEAFGAIAEGAVALVGAVREAVQWMNEHKAVVIAVASVVGVLVTAITAYNIVQGIKSAMDAANVTTVWALVAAHTAQAAAAMAAMAPYILIVAAIAAVIAIIVLCIKYWDEIVVAVKRCWDSVCETLSEWGGWIDENVIQPIVEFFTGLWEDILDVFQSIIDWVKTNWKSIATFIINPFYGVFSYLYTNFEGFRNFVDNIVNSIKQFFEGLWTKVTTSFATMKDTATTVWNNIKTAIITPIEAARDKVKGVVDAIKGFFSGMKLELPKIKLPHFSVTGKLSLSPPSVPKVSIDWYKDGGIFVKPTIFSTATGLKGVGEAGAEAVLPIDKLEGYIANAIERTQSVVNFDMLAAAIEDLANRPVALNINGRQFAYATASDTDSVGGMRSTFRSRGLAVD